MNRTSPILAVLAVTAFGKPPEARHPVSALPPAFHEAPSTVPADVAKWWKKFNDPELNSLIDRALASNLDLRMAQARILEARAGVGTAKSAGRPSISLTGSNVRGTGATVGQTVVPGKQQPPAAAIDSDYRVRQAGSEMSWEHDLFGSNRNTIKAAKYDLAVAEEDRRGILVALLGDVACNYIQVRGYQDQLAMVRESVFALQDNLRLTESRIKAGLATDLELTAAGLQVADAEAPIPALETALKESAHRIAVLSGAEPGSLLLELSAPAPVPERPPEVPAGLPSDLLLRRPDIRKAERQLDAATARSAAARAERFPKFSLTGSVGSHDQQVSGVTLGGNWFFSLGPSVTLPVLSGGRIRAGIQAQNARQQQAELNFQNVVLAALEEVENSLTAYRREKEHALILERAVAANQRSLEIAKTLYTAGVQDFSPVLAAEQVLAIAKAQCSESKRNVAVDLVALYKALGGGWE